MVVVVVVVVCYVPTLLYCIFGQNEILYFEMIFHSDELFRNRKKIACAIELALLYCTHQSVCSELLIVKSNVILKLNSS